MDFAEPWMNALGPGGHYYTPFHDPVSASAFRNTSVPTKRHVETIVTTVPVPALYPRFDGREERDDRPRGSRRGGRGAGAPMQPTDEGRSRWIDDGAVRGHRGRAEDRSTCAGAAPGALVPFATKAAERWTVLQERGGSVARAALPPNERAAPPLPYAAAGDYDAWRQDHLSDAGLKLLTA